MQALPAKLVVTVLLSAALVAVGNPLADGLGLKYWLPGVTGTPVRLFAFLDSGQHADVLVLGSSRSVQGVIPGLLEDEIERLSGRSVTAYNLAMAGNGVTTASFVLRDAIRACGCPDVVLLDVSPRGLARDIESSRRALEYHASLGDALGALPWIRATDELDAVGWGLLRGALNLTLRAAEPPRSHGWRETLDTWSAKGGGPHDHPASRLVPESLADWPERKRERRLRRSPLGRRAPTEPDLVFGGYTAERLDRTVEMVRDCSARLILWASPTTRDHAALYRPAEIDRFRVVLADLAGRPGVEVVDPEDGIELDDEHFADLTHLNARGADRLSRELARRIAGQ